MFNDLDGCDAAINCRRQWEDRFIIFYLILRIKDSFVISQYSGMGWANSPLDLLLGFILSLVI